MKLKYEFEYMDMDGEVAAVPVGENAWEFHGMLTINDTAKELLELMKDASSEEQVCDEYCGSHPEEDPSDVREQVHAFIAELAKEGILEL